MRRHTLKHALPALAAALAWSLSTTLAPSVAGAARPAYPATPVHDVADTLHGTVLVDPYRWLEDDSSATVREWTAAENTLTRKILDTFPGRAALAKRLRTLYSIPVTTQPHACGARLFYSKRAGAQNQPVVVMRESGNRGEPRVVLDPNLLSAEGTVALDWMYPSPDGALVAYGMSGSGSEQSTLRIRDAVSSSDLKEEIPHTQFASVAWDPDGRGFHYTRHPRPGDVPAGEEVFHERVYHHRLGDDAARDSLVFGGEGRPIQESRDVYASSDRRWLFLNTSLDWARTDVFYKPAGSSAPFAPLAVGLDGRISADAYGGRLYLRSSVGAPRYRILTTDPSTPDSSHWKVLVPEQPGVIEEFQIAGGQLALAISEKAISRVLLFGMDGKLRRELALPAPGAVSNLTAEPDGDALYFVFTSFAFPAAVYRYDLKRDALEPLEQNPPQLRAADFEARQEWATSVDGTDVPFFIVHRKGLAIDGDRPTILYGYGGFNSSETPSFSAQVIPWLEAGGVYVQACLRGGGEFGREWHAAGRLDRKQNVFDDFYAVADWLFQHGITRPQHLAARGGSNGGLLAGAALTQRPDLFGAVVCQVPLLDMIRYQRVSIARYWVPEYGSSENPEQFRYLLAYSPYHNVKDGTRYPATLLTAAESDARVAPLHARKMAALLQAKSGGDAPILLRIESKAGHGQGKPTAMRVEEAVDILSFLMMQFGVSPG